MSVPFDTRFQEVKEYHISKFHDFWKICNSGGAEIWKSKIVELTAFLNPGNNKYCLLQY